MTALDWIIVVVYIAGIIAMGYFIGLRQKTRKIIT